jgi:cbb3-type cytochrome oxidase maturation protein
MEVIYGLIPGMIIMGLVAVAVFFWAAKSGQYDDLQGEANRILMDEDLDDVEPQAAADASEPESSEPASSDKP